MTSLVGMDGQEFTVGDYVVLADGNKFLRIAKVYAIKPVNNYYRIGLEIKKGSLVNRKRYARDYSKSQFMKIDYKENDDGI